jgi:hypothetical protein
LVIEWAKEEDTVEEMREKTRKTFVNGTKKRKGGEDNDDDFE